ncbi:hypothetical protein RKD41_004857 [Streptomyces tendae]
MRTLKIVRDCRFKGDGVHYAMLGFARLHNLTLTGGWRGQHVIRHVRDYLRGNA